MEVSFYKFLYIFPQRFQFITRNTPLSISSIDFNLSLPKIWAYDTMSHTHFWNCNIYHRYFNTFFQLISKSIVEIWKKIWNSASFIYQNATMKTQHVYQHSSMPTKHWNVIKDSILEENINNMRLYYSGYWNGNPNPL